MKKLHYLFVFGFVFIAACQKPKNTNCEMTFSVQVTAADKEVTVAINDYDPQTGYDMEYGPTGFAQGTGTSSSFAGTTTLFTVTTTTVRKMEYTPNCVQLNHKNVVQV